jgi:hypothetical protein
MIVRNAIAATTASASLLLLTLLPTLLPTSPPTTTFQWNPKLKRVFYT